MARKLANELKYAHRAAASSFAEREDVQACLQRLADRVPDIPQSNVRRLERRPGQQEERYQHRLSEELVEGTSEPEQVREEVVSQDDERIQRIERQLAELRSEIQALREELGA